MKVFAVLLLTLCAASLVFAHTHHRHSQSNSDDYDSDCSGQECQNQAQHTQHQRTHHGSLNVITSSEDPLAYDLTDLLPYRSKITERLDNSEVLKDQSETKEKIVKLLEDKLHVCQTPGGAKNKVDKQCISRLTAQIMQIIGRLEKGQQTLLSVNDL